MKVSNIVLSAVLLALVAIPSISAQYAPNQGLGSGLGLNVTRYYPYPAVPGKYIDVWFDVFNDGIESVRNIQCELLPEYPFTLESSEDAGHTVTQLLSKQGWLLKYRVRVDAAAVEGDNDLRIRCKSQSVDWVEAKISVSVRAPEAVISIDSISTDPAVAPLAGRVAVKLSVKNAGNSEVRDFSARLDLSSVTTPFGSIQRGAEQRLSQLSAGESANMSFELGVLSDALPKVYKVPLVISWTTVLGTPFTKTEYVAIAVGQKPNLNVGIDSTDLVLHGKSGRVVFRVANAGSVPARFVKVTLAGGEGYTLISPPEVYVGNIESDGVETAEFKVLTASNGGSPSFPLRIEFEDANGLRYTQSDVFSLKLYTEEEALRIGLMQKTDYSGMIMAAVALVLLYGLYRGYRWIRHRKRA